MKEDKCYMIIENNIITYNPHQININNINIGSKVNILDDIVYQTEVIDIGEETILVLLTKHNTSENVNNKGHIHETVSKLITNKKKGVWEYNTYTKHFWYSTSIPELFGLDMSESITLDTLNAYIDDTAINFKEILEILELKGNNSVYINRYKVISKRGEEDIWHKVTITLTDGLLIGEIVDTSDQKMINNYTNILLEYAVDPYCLVNSKGEIVDTNKAYDKIIKLNNIGIEEVFDTRVTPTFKDFIEKVKLDECYKKELTFTTKHNVFNCFEVVVTYWNTLDVLCLAFRDITQRYINEKSLEEVTYKDTLTSVWNRAKLDAYRLSWKVDNLSLILVVDCNGLKFVNDVMGHDTGDKYIAKTAEVLKDVVRANDFIFRTGGDEFLIIANNIKAKNVHERIIDRINQVSNQKEIETDIRVTITPSASVGYAYITNSADLDDGIKEADTKMYQAKLVESSITINTFLTKLQGRLTEETYESPEHINAIVDGCDKIAELYGLDLKERQELRLFASLHDIGKFAVSPDILAKEGKLNIDEYELVTKHCEAGYKIAKSSRNHIGISKFILNHHENWDGTGYPEGIKGADIPLEARILRVVDSIICMYLGTHYKGNMPLKEVLKKIEAGKGTLYDPEVVERALKVYGEK